MKFLYGKPLAEKTLADLKETIARSGVTPGLAVVVVGDDPASHIYVGLKEKAAQSIGMKFERHTFPVAAKTDEIREKLGALNEDPAINGIIVQLPLPSHIDESRVVERILPEKDADGFHEATLRRYFTDEREAQPVFPRAIAHLIQSVGEDFKGKKAVAIVNSELFGRVMDKALTDLGLKTSSILRQHLLAKETELREAKVVVVACGEPGLIRGENLSPGTIVIDGGITRREDKVLGDVDLESTFHLDGWITPVPGGVGPLTVAMLLSRTTELTMKQRGR